jgi:serine beta-lactamase-like protein LACTB, mitochondrial
MATPATAVPRSWPRRIGRSLLRFTIVMLLLTGPNLAFFALWGWPRQPIPPLPPGVVAETASGVSPALAGVLRETLLAQREQAGLASLSAAATFDGDRSWAGATGWADIERRVPATPASRYRTGSVAKPLTATALMRLAEDGALELDAPLAHQLPDLPPALQPLTARQLASHRAGIRHYSRIPAWWMGWHEAFSTRHYPTVADSLAIFGGDRLRFEPGTGFTYSTFGFQLLARQMEVAGGEPFAALMQRRLFEPLGMSATAVDVVAPMGDRVGFYQARDGRYTPAYPLDPSNRVAGGGFVSTPGDLVRLGRALLDDGLLSAPARQAMFTPQPLADGRMNPENYALGWRVDTSLRLLGEDRPTRILHHGGTQQGTAAFLMLVPEHGIAVAVMSNSGSAAARREVQETAYALVRRLVAR